MYNVIAKSTFDRVISPVVHAAVTSTRGATLRHTIFGIHVSSRVENVPGLQAVLTKYGCNIRTRLGIHDADNTSCSPSGLVLVDVFGTETEDFYKELQAQKGLDVQRMDFAE
jgi:hypothetical protein